MRFRNTVLDALVKFERDFPLITRTQIIAFLYIAENPGINMVELAAACRFNLPTASRAARALGPEGIVGSLPPYYGLVDIFSNPINAQRRVLRLSAAGVRYCAGLDEIIRRGSTIDADGEREAQTPLEAEGKLRRRK
jgi:hypothetical protein